MQLQRKVRNEISVSCLDRHITIPNIQQFTFFKSRSALKSRKLILMKHISNVFGLISFSQLPKVFVFAAEHHYLFFHDKLATEHIDYQLLWYYGDDPTQVDA